MRGTNEPEDPDRDLRLRTADEVAAILSVKVRWLKDAAGGGRIPVTALPCGYRWSDAQIREIHVIFARQAGRTDETIPVAPRRRRRPGSSKASVLTARRPRRRTTPDRNASAL